MDLAIRHLRDLGVKNAIVNAGGDLRAIGSRAGHPWRVAIRRPSGGGVFATIDVQGDESVFTSGDYERFFIEEALQSEGTAMQQAARGTYDPAYLNYTMGKLLIARLRDDWSATRGGRQAWREFHDTFLSYGGPPIPLVRQQMMAEGSPRALFPGQ